MSAAEQIARYRAQMSEAAFQRRVIDLAKLYRWRVAHFRPAMMRSGKWATAIEGDAGFPDLVLARNGRVIFAELKAESGHLSAAQREWGAALLGPSVEHFVWRPRDWTAIEAILRP